MKTLQKHSTIVLSFFLIILLQGCVKEDDFRFDKMAAGQWNPELAVPLIHSDLTIRDITGMTDAGMFSINNHLVSLVYKTNIYTKYGYEFFTPVNETDFHTLQFTDADSITLYQTNTVSRSINFNMPLTFPNGEQIDSLTFRKGALRINLASNIPHDGVLNITIPSATLGGQSLSRDIPISASSGSTSFNQDIYDMSGYHMKTTNAGMPNFLNIIYTLTFQNSGTSAPVLNQNFDITTSFDSITPASLFGYFGQREFLTTSNTSQISIFNNFQSGSTYFDDPKMTIFLSNSFGMPIDAQITSLNAILNNGTNLPITGPIPSPLIDYPLTFGQTATNSFYFDKSNSNIQTVFNSAPKSISYDLTAGTNTPLPTFNFMSDSSVFKADMQIEFPLKGYASGFTIQDTVDFSIGDVKEIRSAAFRLNISNGFPVHAYTQLYFTDDNFNVTDSLFMTSQDRIVEAASTDATGNVTQPTIRSADEVFEGVRLQHLFDSKKILIKGIIETQNAPSSMIQILDDYKLDFKIGVHTKLNIEF